MNRSVCGFSRLRRPNPQTISGVYRALASGERCLRDTDAMSMASSLEVRAVFTDHRFVEAALAVPAARRCAGAPHKPFLKRVFGQRLGADFPLRKKQGFVLPLETWLAAGRPQEMMRAALGDRAGLQRLGLDPKAVQRAADGYRRSPAKVPWSRRCSGRLAGSTGGDGSV